MENAQIDQKHLLLGAFFYYFNKKFAYMQFFSYLCSRFALRNYD